VLDPTSCLPPFPDDFYTVPDRSTPTGRRVDFPVQAMPVNAAGVPIDPSAWNLNDGFSPGTPIPLHVPGLDPTRSHLAPITDIGASLAPDSGAILLNERTGQHWPYFAELDANDPDPAEQALIIHPARDLTEGHTYVVALRDLRTADGRPIPPPPAFAALLRGAAAISPWSSAGPRSSGPWAPWPAPTSPAGAWDFTVASTAGLTGRLLHMRDLAFAQLGETAPAFT
jgi:hypothetical protein